MSCVIHHRSAAVDSTVYSLLLLHFTLCPLTLPLAHPCTPTCSLTPGIGEEVAKLYASQGATLFLGARRVDKLTAVQEDCVRNGAGAVTVFSCDVSHEAQCQAFINQVLDETGGRGIDVLVLNAGVGQVCSALFCPALEYHLLSPHSTPQHSTPLLIHATATALSLISIHIYHASPLCHSLSHTHAPCNTCPHCPHCPGCPGCCRSPLALLHRPSSWRQWLLTWISTSS